jgi:hypothetical protein
LIHHLRDPVAGVGVGGHAEPIAHADQAIGGIIAVRFHPVARQVAAWVVGVRDNFSVSSGTVAIPIQTIDLINTVINEVHCLDLNPSFVLAGE